MTTISITLPGDQVAELRLRAEQAGLPLEAYLARCVGQILDRKADDFRRAAERVLENNSELYRRLD
ncbi:MAG: DNA-binding protein [Planctomycetia bacterium]